MQKLSFQRWLQIATEVFRKDSRNDANKLMQRINSKCSSSKNKIKKHQEQLKINSGQLKATQEKRLLGNTQKKCQLFIPAARQSAARGQETKPLHRIKGKHRPVLHRLREDVQESGASGAGSGHPCSPEEPKNVSKLTRERQAHPTQL